jgi:predicted nucleotidyltransferase component of viral defense system
MDTGIDFAALYRLQDRVLKIVADCETGFYLTGGTCLHRFIAPRRYSEDLDLFCSDTALYRDYVRELIAAFGESGLELKTVVDTRDFVRLRIDGSLQADLVNDRVFRCGRSEISPQGYAIDNLQNILANKLSAVVGRDEAKDLFDIAMISQITEIDWTTALENALRKSSFEKDYLIYRIQSFPLNMLEYLTVIKSEYIEQCRLQIPLIAKALGEA